MRPLFINETIKAQVRAVTAFAATNLYRPGHSEQVPGDDPRHVLMLDTYRCVFSYTKIGDSLFRHLSVSVPSEKYPHPIAFCVIADLFGFTGWDGKSAWPAADWIFNVNREEHCVVAAQQVK